MRCSGLLSILLVLCADSLRDKTWKTVNFYSFTGKKELTIDLAPNVWLHSLADRALHQYHGGHGFKSCSSPNFFFQAFFFAIFLRAFVTLLRKCGNFDF